MAVLDVPALCSDGGGGFASAAATLTLSRRRLWVNGPGHCPHDPEFKINILPTGII